MKSTKYPGLWELKHRKTYQYRKEIAGYNGMWDCERKCWLFMKQLDYLRCLALCEEVSPELVLNTLKEQQLEDWVNFELPVYKTYRLSDYVS
jgi:hypothetical protein